jgi:putative phosphoesterase
MFGWSKWQAAPGKGRGIAFARYKNSATYTAVAMEAEVDKATGAIRVKRVSSASDCGDIISPPTLERFAGLPMRVVYGNNDGERSGLKKKCLEFGFGEIDDTICFTHAGKTFFVNHGTSVRVLNEAIDSQSYDYVLHGHTHEERNQVIGSTRVINPGALYSAERYTIAFLRPETGDVEFVEISE